MRPRARGQPVITYNRIGRKIDGVIGLIERLRQDPKAYPRTPAHEQGADLATAVMRFVLDLVDWRSLSPQCAHDGAVDGIGGVEMGLEDDGKGGSDVTLDRIDPTDFFYDPRAMRPDFSDARYLGLAKWLDRDAAIEMFPEMADQIRDHVGMGADTQGEIWDDKEIRWTNSREKRLRVVEHWYKRGGEWIVTFYSGSLELMTAPSVFFDEQGKTMCRLVMYSNGIDHDGDRYGFCRNLKGPQDEINHRRSKGLHQLNSRRVLMEAGAVEDVEATRREIAKADGVIEITRDYRFDIDSTTSQDAAGNLQLLTEAKAELENFGPNPALVGQGTGVAGSSGRAIALLQQAGIAELGPYILRYRGWKIRVYRAIWNAVQKHWTGERYVRLTDDEELAKFIQVNGMEMGPAGPVLVNALGGLDVDIIVDEGPDQINSMADAFDLLIALAQQGAQVPPQVVIELSALPGNVKKRVMGMLEQQAAPNPAAEAATQLQLADAQAGVEGKQAKAARDAAEAAKTAQEVRANEALLASAPFRGLVPVTPQEQGFMR